MFVCVQVCACVKVIHRVLALICCHNNCSSPTVSELARWMTAGLSLAGKLTSGPMSKQGQRFTDCVWCADRQINSVCTHSDPQKHSAFSLTCPWCQEQSVTIVSQTSIVPVNYLFSLLYSFVLNIMIHILYKVCMLYILSCLLMSCTVHAYACVCIYICK